MRFRCDEQGWVAEFGDSLDPFDLELPDWSIPPALVQGEFAGVVVRDGALVIATSGLPVWLQDPDGEPTEQPTGGAE